ncbi:hypothetical protein HRbin30_01345 [bacterium HR30]|nr:hypothetical protein HRbin30_01345 [bacterium HR30]
MYPHTAPETHIIPTNPVHLHLQPLIATQTTDSRHVSRPSHDGVNDDSALRPWGGDSTNTKHEKNSDRLRLNDRSGLVGPYNRVNTT